MHIAHVIATWFGVGKIGIAPGTMGSLAALPFGFLIHFYFGPMALLAASLLLFIIGVWASEVYMANHSSEHDPKEIVVDEVSGQWLLLVGFAPELGAYIIAFILFRLFDVLKPRPVSVCDEKVPGGFGVMFDDMLAALYPIFCFALFAIFCNFTGQSGLLELVFGVLGGDGFSWFNI